MQSFFISLHQIHSKNTQASTDTTVTVNALNPKKATLPTNAGTSAIRTSRIMVWVVTRECTWGELEIVSS